MTVQKFKELHYKNDILHIGNVWDVQSALLMEELGYKALGTSSLAIASSLGYEDGEEMSFHELFQICKKIISKVKIPLSVDLEGGYSRDSKEIVKNIISLSEIGVVGINIEDSIVENGERKILAKEELAKLLKDIKSNLAHEDINIFINARTDSFIMGLDNPLENTIDRIKWYDTNGADGIFIPCVVDINDITEIVNSTALPINVMTMPNLDDFNTLQNVGVKRVSQGPLIYSNVMEKFKKLLLDIKNDGSFKSLF